MTALANIQWRPITSQEIAADDGMSIRAWRDIAWAENNAKYHATRDPIRCQACFPGWDTPDNTTDEHAILVSVPVVVPDGYHKLLVYLGHRRIAGAGNITWTLYVDSGIYFGPQRPFDATLLTSAYKSVSFVSLSDRPSLPVAEVDLVRDQFLGHVCLILTGKNSSESTRGRVTTITVVPE